MQAILDQERGNENAGVVSPYRVLEFENGNPPYNNKLAYWRIQNAYGYQGAKMRRYQDLVDVVGLHPTERCTSIVRSCRELSL